MSNININNNKVVASDKGFSIDPQGFSGAYTCEYIKTWQGVKFQNGAEDWLLLQLDSKSSVDALYALVGLKVMRSSQFDDAAKALSKGNDEVMFCRGGRSYSFHPIAGVIEYIKEKELKSPI